MLKEKFQNLIPKGGDDNNKRKMENLVVFVVVLIITCIAINMIWGKKDSKSTNNIIDKSKVLAQEQKSETEEIQSTNMEKELEGILGNIKGVGDVKVLISYSQSSVILPMYDENSKQSNIEENDTEGGIRKTTETNNQKTIIYKEINGEKVPITQSVVNPKIEGAIITARWS